MLDSAHVKPRHWKIERFLHGNLIPLDLKWKRSPRYGKIERLTSFLIILNTCCDKFMCTGLFRFLVLIMSPEKFITKHKYHNADSWKLLLTISPYISSLKTLKKIWNKNGSIIEPKKLQFQKEKMLLPEQHGTLVG